MTAAASRHTLINLIASICHEANRAYCVSIGDTSQPDWIGAPDWQRTSAVQGVESIADGLTTRPEQSHETWSAAKIADGWKFGPVKDPEKKEHPCLVPFAELPPDQQTKDHLFFAVAETLLYRAGLKAPAQASAGEAKPSRRYDVEQKTIDDIDNRFTYHAPKADQLPRYGTLRFEALGLAHHIAVLTPKSREQSLALTHLETAVFFANAAIARNE